MELESIVGVGQASDASKHVGFWGGPGSPGPHLVTPGRQKMSPRRQECY